MTAGVPVTGPAALQPKGLSDINVIAIKIKNMPTQEEHNMIDTLSKLVLDIMTLTKPPLMPDRFVSVDSFQTLYAALISLRAFLSAISEGNLSESVSFKGYIGGTLKTLQANLKHMTWQTKRVASGDFSQRIEFMGEFARSFNTMVIQLDQTIKELVNHKSELLKANENLVKEIFIRKKTEAALRESREVLRVLANTDTLTGLNDRGHFNELAKNEIARTCRYSRPLSVIMFDIDFFKSINDAYGHWNGDIVLQRVATITKKMLRKTDIAARYGGEEFILLLPETSAKTAAAVAEKIREKIENTIVKTEQYSIKLTASFGVTDYPGKADPESQDRILFEVVTNADKALYASKNSGRNRVTIHQSEEELPYPILSTPCNDPPD